VIFQGYHKGGISFTLNSDFIPIPAGELDGIIAEGAIHEGAHDFLYHAQHLDLGLQRQVEMSQVMEIVGKVIVAHACLLSALPSQDEQKHTEQKGNLSRNIFLNKYRSRQQP